MKMRTRTQRTFPLLLALALAGAALLVPPPARAEFEEKVTGARPAALGGAFVSVDGGPLSLAYNPAWLGDGSAECGFASNRVKLFGMGELVDENAYASAPRDGTLRGFAAGYERFGGGTYREKTLLLGYGREFASGMLAGLAVKNLKSDIASTPTASSLAFDLGWGFKFRDGARAGFAIRNANNPEVNERLGRLYRGGATFPLTARARLTLEAERGSGGTRDQRRMQWMVGEEFAVSEALTLRAGFSSLPARISLGAGFRVRDWTLDYAFRSHEALDATHLVSLGRRWR